MSFDLYNELTGRRLGWVCTPDSGSATVDYGSNAIIIVYFFQCVDGQILTYKDGPRTERVNNEAMKRKLKLSCLWFKTIPDPRAPGEGAY